MLISFEIRNCSDNDVIGGVYCMIICVDVKVEDYMRVKFMFIKIVCKFMLVWMKKGCLSKVIFLYLLVGYKF